MLYFRYMLQYILTNLHRSSPNLQRPSLQLLYLSQAYTIKACQSVYHISPSIFSLNKNLFTKVVVLGPFLCYAFITAAVSCMQRVLKRRAYANASMKGQYITNIMCSHFALYLDRFPCLSSLILCVVLLCCRRIKKKKRKKEKKKNKQTEQKTKCSNRNTQPMLSLPLPLVFQQ